MVSPGAKGIEGVSIIGESGDDCICALKLAVFEAVDPLGFIGVNTGFGTFAISTVFVVCFSEQVSATGVL